MLALVDVIKPNAREARMLTGVDVRDHDSARAAGRQLLDRGVGAVAIQAGDAVFLARAGYSGSQPYTTGHFTGDQSRVNIADPPGVARGFGLAPNGLCQG
ncbi:MAG TPA: PfkB family carbohydrate kinase [Roseiflexaceae bacterium]|nr:PfkB family carbohydrate kinase [Roseiflexaceae bacterium]